jgi:hypothetical protein
MPYNQNKKEIGSQDRFPMADIDCIVGVLFSPAALTRTKRGFRVAVAHRFSEGPNVEIGRQIQALEVGCKSQVREWIVVELT